MTGPIGKLKRVGKNKEVYLIPDLKGEEEPRNTKPIDDIKQFGLLVFEMYTLAKIPKNTINEKIQFITNSSKLFQKEKIFILSCLENENLTATQLMQHDFFQSEISAN